MEENFKEMIEKIKKGTIDPEETKKYILTIKKTFGKSFQDCKNEQEKADMLQECLEEYKKDLEFRGHTEHIFHQILMYSTYKRILSNYNGNKANFDSIIREAKRRENIDSAEALSVSMNTKESMISAARNILRSRSSISEKMLIQSIQEEKGNIAKSVKEDMINVIQASVRVLEEYGAIDEYIETSNEELEQLGLSGLKYVKRNPIPDEQYDSNGNLVENVEDIGVIDSFSKEKLEELSVEDLEIMTTFWESKYLQERLGLSKAMATIDTLELWHDILSEDDEKIANIDNDRIVNALKKDLALTYLCKNRSEITPRIKKQYKKFLKENEINSDKKLEDEVSSLSPEVSNLEETARDVAIMECLIVYQLREKDMRLKKWGVIKENPTQESEENQDTYKGTIIALENANFRGPLIMEIPEEVLKDFLSTEELNLPEYNKQLDETYCNIMARLCLPSNKFFTTYVKKSFGENPSSKILASLAGKKVREER